MGAWRAVAAAAIGAVACVALVVQAAADEPRLVALTWSAPVECPDEAAVRAGVAQLLVGSSASVDGHAEVRRTGERWQVVVTMNGGERRLEADSCRALADATALIVAMAVDPARVAANRSSQDAGVASASPPTVAATVADASAAAPAALQDAAPPPAPPPPLPGSLSPSHPVPPETSTPPSALLRFAVSAAATGDFGTLPTAAFGPSLGLAWTPGRFRLELAGAYFPSSSESIPADGTSSAGTAQFSLLSASLRLCYLGRLASFELGPCAGAEAGSLQGASSGIQATASGASALFAFDAGLLAAWHFAKAWAFFARGDALLQTFRPTFEVTLGTNDAALYLPGLVTGRGSLGVELRF